MTMNHPSSPSSASTVTDPVTPAAESVPITSPTKRGDGCTAPVKKKAKKKKPKPRPKHERAEVSEGFADEIYGRPDQWKHQKQRQLSYDHGRKLGEEIIRIYAGRENVLLALKSNKKLHARAREVYELIVRNIKNEKLPRDVEEQRLYEARIEPCADCPWAGICFDTAMTCGKFRAYASRDSAHEAVIEVPNKFWSDSFD